MMPQLNYRFASLRFSVFVQLSKGQLLFQLFM
jgi:hypothetical protein